VSAPDFWIGSGWHLTDPTPSGMLAVTDDYLRAVLRRPEVAPVDESCAEERRLHAELLDDPRLTVPAGRLAGLADPDARETYAVVLRLRDLLVAHGTLEAFYLARFRSGRIEVPPLILDQVAHAVLRGILDGVDDAFRARAAELLFRPQILTRRDGAPMLGDEETLEALRSGPGKASREIELDVLTRDSAPGYWARSDLYDMVLEIGFTRPGLDALCRVMEAWIAHMLGARVAIHPVQSIRDERWSWHVGLDAEASRLLNDLYEGREVEEERIGRLISLFRLEFADASAVLERVRGRPIYLALCAAPDGRVRMKPQNLLVNLPLAPAG
jgi:Family of unknown function (DUF6352)